MGRSRFLSNLRRFGLLSASAIAAFVAWRAIAPVGPVLGLDRSAITISAAETNRFKEEGKRPTGTFILTNLGDRNLRVELNDASCGCAVRDFGRERVLKPGESTALTVEVPIPPVGPGRARVKLATNSTTTPGESLVVTVENDVRPPFLESLINQIRFHCDSRDPVSQVLQLSTFENVASQPWIRTAETDVRGLTIEGAGIGEEERDGFVRRIYHFNLGLTPSEAKSDRGTVWLRGESPGAIIASLPVVIVTIAPVTVTPCPVFIRLVGSDAPRTTRLLVRATDRRFPLEVSVKAISSHWLSASVSTKSGANLHIVEVTAIDNPPDSAVVYHVLLATNHPDCAEIAVPVYAVDQQ
jgi:hypothetical protein